MPVDLTALVREWMESEALVQRSAVYKLMTAELGVSQEAAEAHAAVLAPVMKHLGT